MRLQFFLTPFFPHLIEVFFGEHIVFNAFIFPTVVNKQGHPNKKQSNDGNANTKFPGFEILGLYIKAVTEGADDGNKY